MDHKKERKEFAEARPLPAFGRIVGLFVECLQLKNPDSYTQNSPQLQSALKVLGKRTVDSIFAGEMVTEPSKLEISRALAQCLKAHPALPLDDVTEDELATEVRKLWTAHEHTSGRLTGLPQSRGLVRVLVRHAIASLAVRAGALAWLNGDRATGEAVPTWATDDRYRAFLDEMLRITFGTRDATAAKLSELTGTNSPGQSEVDRWLDDLDLPGPNHIRNWDVAFAAATNSLDSPKNCHRLFRFCVGRRLWRSLASVIPADLQAESLSAFAKMREAVLAHLLESRGDPTEQRHHAVVLALTGTITDPLLAHRIVRSQSDALWRAHVAALVTVDSVPTTGIVELSQTWLAIAELYHQVEASRRPPTLDEFVRIYFQKAEAGGSPPADYAKLAEAAHRHQSNGDLANAEALIIQLIRLAPFASGPWEMLATNRLFQGRPDDALSFYRKAVHLEPQNTTARGKLVSLLSSRDQLGEAERILFEAPPKERNSSDWWFAHGNLLLRQGRYAQAKVELLKCARQGYLPKICYQLLGVATSWLNQPAEQREYEKRAREFE